jgi:hypothetical protein
MNNKDIFDFIAGVQQTRWLLSKDIADDLEKDLWPRATKLQELITTLGSPGEDRAENIRKKRELKNWIASQRENLDSKFDPFLRIWP